MRAMRQRRPEYHRLYASKAWAALRASHLAEHPLCAWCSEAGYTRAAEVVDHSLAHRGNEALFFDPANLLSLCRPHHDSAAQSRDRTGRVRGCDINGQPLDPHHPWNLERRARAH